MENRVRNLWFYEKLFVHQLYRRYRPTTFCQEQPAALRLIGFFDKLSFKI
jgi:hypothetical protein